MPNITFLALPVDYTTTIFEPLHSDIPIADDAVVGVTVLQFRAGSMPGIIEGPSAPVPPADTIAATTAVVVEVTSDLETGPAVAVAVPGGAEWFNSVQRVLPVLRAHYTTPLHHGHTQV